MRPRYFACSCFLSWTFIAKTAADGRVSRWAHAEPRSLPTWLHAQNTWNVHVVSIRTGQTLELEGILWNTQETSGTISGLNTLITAGLAESAQTVMRTSTQTFPNHTHFFVVTQWLFLARARFDKTQNPPLGDTVQTLFNEWWLWCNPRHPELINNIC